jgi:hypothetical protein
MWTANRTREQMSFQQIYMWNGNPCMYALIGDVTVAQSRPAVDPASSGDVDT